MGCGASKSPALLCTCSTGVLVRDHVTDKGAKTGAGAAKLLKMDGNLLYVLGNKGLAVFDTEHPNKMDAAAAKITQIDTGCVDLESEADMLVNGSIMYIVGGKGLGICDISNAREPKMVGDVMTTGVLSFSDAATLLRYDNYMYIAGGKGLAVYDISNPQSPLKLGDGQDTGVIAMCAQSCMLLGTPPSEEKPPPLYVCGGKGLQVYSLEDPKVPAKVGEKIDTGALCHDGGASMAIKGDRLFVCGGKGLANLDLSNPMEPKIVACISTGCCSWQGGASIILKDDTLFVCGGNGLGTFSILNHTVAPAMKSISTGVCSNSGAVSTLLDIEKDIFYVVGGKGLTVYQASLLAAPVKA